MAEPLDTEGVLAALAEIVGTANVITGADAAPYLTDWRKRFTGAALAVVRPATAEEVARVVRLTARHGLAVVPQGGNTGLCGGATPDAGSRNIVLSTSRLNRVRSVDVLNNTMILEAGVPLAHAQEAAREAGRLFPLSLAAEGSATIGGNLSTNAGGTQVLRYGNARELCLGLEVVTAEGEIWSGLNALRKNNTGYDLRDLFIGAEGTLGVITAACVKLFPRPQSEGTALVALRSVENALALLDLAQQHAASTLTGFELFSDFCLSLVERHFSDHRSPFAARHDWHVLIEISNHQAAESASTLLEHLLETALAAGLIEDAVIAQSGTQAAELWELREHISEAQAAEGKNIKHDISVPISRIAEFVRETDALLAQRFPGMRMVTFGHLGDGNLHYNVSAPGFGSGQDDGSFITMQPAVYETVHDQVHRYGGSVSAEHGIGQLKRSELLRYKSPVELALMRRIKQALDPDNRMNPGKVLG
ncbi:hydroxyacid dehydrogenase [beta proteobacterium AAP99]|nr:hydroxyacid dehydrogenase [beta proteobacterium AAP99]